MSAGVAILGSTSSHGGTMTSASGSKLQTPQGAACVDGDLHSCPITGHGVTAVTGNSTRATVGGKKVILNGSVAGCGAVINGNFATRTALS
jgi:uncharacterized Zn-binding protein involved in type VI secretion